MKKAGALPVFFVGFAPEIAASVVPAQPRACSH
jgi:hypothetical protein